MGDYIHMDDYPNDYPIIHIIEMTIQYYCIQWVMFMSTKMLDSYSCMIVHKILDNHTMWSPVFNS